MRRPHLFGLLGVVVAGLVALAIGTRPVLKAQQPAATIAPAFVGGAFGGSRAADRLPEPIQIYHVEAPPKSVDEFKTYFKLQEKVPMNFPKGTALGDVIKYIRQATIDEKYGFPKGLPIFVDPIGLQDADKTMADTIEFEFEGMRLAKSLRLILKQLSLTYEVDSDGLITITTAGGDGAPLSHEEANWQAFDALRSEVHALREEIWGLRQGGVPELRPNGAPAGAMTKGLGGMM